MKRNDHGHEETDKGLAKLEKQISKEYTQAYKDVKQKFEKYMQDFDRKDKVKRELVKSGQLSQSEYIEWRKNQLLVGQRWEEMRDSLAKDITNTQRIANSMTKEFLPDAYAINHNYGTFEVERGSHINTSYTLYDRDTVNRLIRDNPKLLPAPKVDIPKAQLWNKRKLTSAITQGVLQGEAIPDIAKRLMTVTDMSKAAAIRNARTMTTSAECAGRIDSYKRAEDMGIEMQQAWVATLDDRTRHEHRLLDGQIRTVGEPFEVEGQKILYPGDPAAEPYLVYNCRCTVIALVKGTSLENGIGDYPRILDPALGDMTYEEWKHAHEVAEEQEELKFFDITPTTTKLQSVMSKKDYEEYSNLVMQNPHIASCYKYADDIKFYKGGGEYDGNTIFFDYPQKKLIKNGMSRYHTVAHEYGHYIDEFVQGKSKLKNGVLHWAEQGKVANVVGKDAWRIFPQRISSSDEFLSAMRKDFESVTNDINNIKKYCRLNADTTVGVQDAINGHGLGKIFWGHGPFYAQTYKDVEGIGKADELMQAYNLLGNNFTDISEVKMRCRDYRTASELWANLISAETTGGKELESLKEYFPNSYNCMKEVLKNIK